MKWRILMAVLAAGGGLALTTAAQEPKKADPAPAMKKADDKKADDKKAVAKKPSKMRVLVPVDADVTLSIRGDTDKDTETKATGDIREFETPPLDPNKKYVYTLTAKVVPNNYVVIMRVREVEFKGGEEVVVDLRNKAETDKEDVKIRWVPTPEDICEEMCKLAKVGEKDTVYDYGCGDAITLRTAVQKFNAKKGVGVDIDPKMVQEAKDAVKKDGLEKKIEIREGDALKQEPPADCTVIMIYMSDYLMDRLQPFFEKLKPGTRIVSHRFVMAKWKADKTITVAGKDGDEYVLHLWTVPEKKK